MKKVLVTGAAGFIASQVCEQLLQDGVEVVGIDNLNNYYDVRLKHFRLEKLSSQKNFTFQTLDIENKQDLGELFKKHDFEVIYNLAARAGVRYSMENPEIYYSTNTLGTLNILELLKTAPHKKLVLASTSSLYAGQTMPFLESLAVNEPISPYAATKKAAELMCYTYSYLYGIDVNVVRYFTVYGPAGRPDMSIFRFIRWIQEGKEIELFGDGLQARDFTYVDDIARGTILAGQNLKGFNVINLGGGQQPISLQTIIGKLETLIGKKAKIKNFDFHKADIMETWADITKAHEILKWSPKTSIDEGLEKTVQSFRKYPILNEVELP